jgi:predicted dehydrogenase
MGRHLALDPSRVYNDYTEMIKAESALPPEQRIDFVAVTTPNNWHFPIARDFLKAGFHVMCEKPMTLNSKEAKDLQKLVEKTGLVFGLMHNYTGYPMAKLARDMVKKGELGNIRKIVVQYPQGWLATALEKTGQMQASWRTDPKQTGAGGCAATSALMRPIWPSTSRTSRSPICAELTTFVQGVWWTMTATACLSSTTGPRASCMPARFHRQRRNNLAIWVHGEKASLEWHQEHPNYLYVRRMDKPEEVWKRGNGYVGAYSAAAGRGTRIPSGHPEAFLEAFANNYMNFCETVKCKIAGEQPSELALDFPSVEAGVRGLLFIETVVASSQSAQKWTAMKK